MSLGESQRYVQPIHRACQLAGAGVGASGSRVLPSLPVGCLSPYPARGPEVWFEMASAWRAPESPRLVSVCRGVGVGELCSEGRELAVRTVDGGIGLGPGADRGASAGGRGRRVGETAPSGLFGAARQRASPSCKHYAPCRLCWDDKGLASGPGPASLGQGPGKG